MSLDEISPEDKEALRKEWDTENRLKSLEKTQLEQGNDLKRISSVVDPMVSQLTEIHEDIKEIKGSRGKGWRGFMSKMDDIYKIIITVGIISTILWVGFNWVVSVAPKQVTSATVLPSKP